MRSLTAFNSGWHFHEGFEDRLREGFQSGQAVVLPHTAVELPAAYFDEAVYQRPFTYQKILTWSGEFEGREVSLVFDGATPFGPRDTTFIAGTKGSLQRYG